MVDNKGFWGGIVIAYGAAWMVSKDLITSSRVCGHPNFWCNLNRLGQFTCSNAFVWSMKAMKRGQCCSRDFSWSWHKENIMSTVILPALKLHCDSWYMHAANIWSLWRMTHAKTLPTITRSKIPQKLPQSPTVPFVLVKHYNFASCISWGTVLSSQHKQRSLYR